ncbi:MAG: hypothetical protein K9M17_03375 [Mariprofundaceae bacterium]|nr:hypothetical protein [Mariprofundaceae bacterium]
MVEISSEKENPGWKLYLIPGFIIVMGMSVVLAALDVIPADPDSFHAPRWVVATFGMMFVLAGVMLLFSDYPRIRHSLATLMVLCFAVGTAWVSLYSIPEEWSGGIGFLSPHTNGMIAKTFAGLGALVLFYAFIHMLIQLITGKIPKLPKG